MNTNQSTREHRSASDARKQFRNVALEGWEMGKSDYLTDRAPNFHNPMTYFEKAYCFGYMELALNENWDQYRDIAKDGFEHGQTDYYAGRELFFDTPETYYEKGYFLGYTSAERNHQQSDTEHPEI